VSALSPLGVDDAVTRPAPDASTRARPQSIMRPLLRDPLGVTAAAILTIIVVACAAAPLIAPYNPDATSFTAELSGPSGRHLLGTDELGRDILSRLLYGGQPTLLAAAEATLIAIVIGTVLGVASGYLKGWTDRVLSVWGDLLLTLPVLVILVVVVSVFPTSLFPAMIPLGLLLSAAPMRVLRSVTMAVREDAYIEAARVSGLSHWQIMRRHVVARIKGPIVVQATLVAAVAVILTSGLAFLGFGVQVPAPSWGTMVAEAASQYQQQPWFLVPTGGIIALTVLSLGLLGDALRDAVADQWTGRSPRRARKRSSAFPGAFLGAFLGRGPARPGRQAAAVQLAQSPAGVLQVRDLSIDVPGPAGDVTLVSGISFDLVAGRTLAIVGESGCGKSVTARALLGIAPPGGRIAGSIRFDGTELAGARDAQWRDIRGRRIAFIGQEPMSGLDPAQTIGSALTEVVRAYSGCGRKQARQRAVALLGRVRIDDPQRVARLYPHQVSGGMAQRVTIARALAGDPEILVADEPTTALDVTIQADILALLRSLQLTSEIAVLLVTHDWGVVAGLADDVLVMYAGQAVEQAAAEVVFDTPRHPYTEALLGSDPHGATPGMPLPAIPGTVPAPGHWPSGCRFADRCRYATPECTAAEPALDDTAPGHRARCIHADRLEGAR